MAESDPEMGYGYSEDQLYVVTAISNPIGFRSRAERYKRFEREIRSQGGNLITVEAAFGKAIFEATEPNNPKHIQLRTNDVLWGKENLLNVGISRLPHDWEYVAWVDADLTFLREDWIIETIKQLQHHAVVQCWETACDLGPTGEIFLTADSFVSCWKKGRPDTQGYASGGHPGYAWAIRREAFEKVGGLLDRALLGAADHIMAKCLIGKPEDSFPSGVHPNLKRLIYDWEARARLLHQNIGYVPGTVAHHWHGKKSDRKYRERWSILVDHQYDPYKDIEPDYQGVLKFTSEGERLRNDVRQYFLQRNEDSIDP